jgi:oligopeptidase B
MIATRAAGLASAGLLFCTVTTALVPAAGLAQQPRPPVARTIAKVDTLHGEVRVDPYFWLREKTNPEVISYLEAENAFTAAGMKHTEALQDTLYREMLGRIKETDLSVPYFDDGYWYYTRTEQGKSYPIFARKKGTVEAPEEVYLDQNERAAGKKFHGLGGVSVSPDGRQLLFIEDTTAFRQYTLYVKDLATGKLTDSIPKVWNGLAWADDNRTFFYMTADSAMRGNAVWRHVVGQPKASAVNVFREDSVLYNVGVSRSKSGRYVFLTARSFTASEFRVIPTAQPTAPSRLIAARRPDIEYSIDHIDGAFLLRTNDGARNFRIMRVPETDLSPAAWTEWQPASDSVFIEGTDVFRNFVVVSERARGLPRLRVRELSSGTSHTIEFPEQAYYAYPTSNADFGARTLRFAYTSPVTPSSVYDYDMATRERVLKKRIEVPGYDASRYTVRRLLAPARDGVLVPVTVLLPRDWRQDASHPLLLYSYGSYGSSTEATFNANVLSLVDRGFGYALAHIRGGQEMGRQWYDDGKMLKKMNTFTDFIDAADHLVRERYTQTDRLVINGGSAGGLLMGAVMNMRPDLFRAVVADVPFVDVINTMRDASLPLTAQEWLQWGNPAIPEQYRYMMQYSPYDNIAAKAYPWLLVTTSLNDSQVMYWEPAKFVARLRTAKTDSNPLFFKTNMGGGHGGSSGRYDRLREIAFRYAFMLESVRGPLRPKVAP